MRILVVEDEADLNLLLCKVLTKAGYTVDGCLDGEDAQAHLLGAAYDGILLDVMLPKKDGYTLVRELRDQGNDTPVLFLTARDSVADRVKGLDLGGDDYLVRNKEKVLSREQIEDQIWNYDYAGSSNNVDVYLSRLRKKIDGGREEKLIHTVRGMGWAIREPAAPKGGTR